MYKYHEKLIGEHFVEFIKENFFKKNPSGRLFLQDGDTWQVCWATKSAMREIGCQVFAIPVRSTHSNPIENMLHLIHKKLHEDALAN